MTPDGIRRYEERVKRRVKEVAGLKEALQILEAESAPAFLSVRPLNAPERRDRSSPTAESSTVGL